MEAAPRSRLDMKVKAEDDSADARMAADKPTYRSWKKKYRKMRNVFDHKMREGEELHRAEQKALATARRLAIQKDRLLDLLLDVNNSAQIPPEKRIDLSLDLPSDDEALFLDIDRPSTPPRGPVPATSYKELLREVPHVTFPSAAEHFPELVADLEAGRDSPADPAQGQHHPPSFLTADDIDNYIWELDTHLLNDDRSPDADKADSLVPLPTLAPLAHTGRTNSKDSQRDFALRNPTSVYNWLRKHAPKTFLQDAEHDKDSGKDQGGAGGAGDDHGPGSGRRLKWERAPRGSGSSRGKRASAAHSRAAESLDDLDDDYGYGGGAATPSSAGGGGGSGAAKGKRKRVVDDDPGYRPKGGSSRPAKKKRKSSIDGIKRPPFPHRSLPGGRPNHRPAASSERSSAYKGPRKSGPTLWADAVGQTAPE